MASIIPTLGRVMWFVAADNFKHHNGFSVSKGSRYRCDVIDESGSENNATVAVTDRTGISFAFSVNVRQPDMEAPVGQHYVEWMPFQVGQAAKTETPYKNSPLELDDLRKEVAELKAMLVPNRDYIPMPTKDNVVPFIPNAVPVNHDFNSIGSDDDDDFGLTLEKHDDTELHRAADDGMLPPITDTTEQPK